MGKAGADLPAGPLARYQHMSRASAEYAIGLRLDAGLAQLVEHLICNQGVGGSIPSAGTVKSMILPMDRQANAIKINGSWPARKMPGR
jgi:hypothetical protein